MDLKSELTDILISRWQIVSDLVHGVYYLILQLCASKNIVYMQCDNVGI